MILYNCDNINMDKLFKTRELGFSISTGYDKITGGAYRGQVHLYCSPSGTGKTTTGVGTMMKLLSQNLSVLYVTFEEAPESIVERMLRYLSGSTEKEACMAFLGHLRAYKFGVITPENTKAGWDECIPFMKDWDCVVWDYVNVPFDAYTDSAGVSFTLNKYLATLHKFAIENNQFIFAMAQSKGKTIEEDTIPFSDFSDVRLSSTMGQSCEVVMIARRVNNEILYIDYIKVRHPYEQYSNVRVRRKINCSLCSWRDEAILDPDGNELEVLTDGTEGFAFRI